MNRKVTVVGGAGNVGATVARGVAERQLADVVVIDIAEQKAAGVALDMLEACPIWGSDARVLGTGDYAESANSDIVVVTSGVPRNVAGALSRRRSIGRELSAAGPSIACWSVLGGN